MEIKEDGMGKGGEEGEKTQGIQNLAKLYLSHQPLLSHPITNPAFSDP